MTVKCFALCIIKVEWKYRDSLWAYMSLWAYISICQDACDMWHSNEIVMSLKITQLLFKLKYWTQLKVNQFNFARILLKSMNKSWPLFIPDVQLIFLKIVLHLNNLSFHAYESYFRSYRPLSSISRVWVFLQW